MNINIKIIVSKIILCIVVFAITFSLITLLMKNITSVNISMEVDVQKNVNTKIVYEIYNDYENELYKTEEYTMKKSKENQTYTFQLPTNTKSVSVEWVTDDIKTVSITDVRIWSKMLNQTIELEKSNDFYKKYKSEEGYLVTEFIIDSDVFNTNNMNKIINGIAIIISLLLTCCIGMWIYNIELKDDRDITGVINTCIFCVIIIGFCAINFLKVDSSFSVIDGTILSERPKIKPYDNVFDKQFINSYDEYVRDNFIIRTKLLEDNYWVSNVLGINKFNDTYIQNGTRDVLVYATEYDEETIIKNAKEYSNFYNNVNNQGIKLITAIIPTKSVVVDVPEFVQDYSIEVADLYENKLENVSYTDYTELIKATYEPYFYTDHHLNANGTYKVYANLINEINKEIYVGYPLSIDEVEYIKYENSYVGHRGRTIAYGYNAGQQRDDFVLIRPKADIELNVDYNFQGYTEGDLNLLYDYKYTDTNEKYMEYYNVYTGGNQAVIRIENLNANNDYKITIVKDSFGNPIIPLLVQHFRSVEVIDPRYYDNVATMDRIIATKPDIVVGLYNYSTVVDETFFQVLNEVK